MRTRKSQMGITELPFEIRRTYRQACKRGYMDGYTSPAWRKSFVGAFLTKYPNRTAVLDALAEACHRKFPRWQDLTTFVLEDFARILRERQCESTVRTSCNMLKSVINAHKDDVRIPASNYETLLKAKKEPSQAVFLTEDEITVINNYEPENERERSVKRIFMIEALTGARHSDAERLAPENITNSELRYVPQKTTSCVISLPAHKLLPKYLVSTKEVSLAAFNYILRDICRKCGINERIAIFRHGENTTGEKWEYVSSHTGRRSFATNLFLRNVDITIIQRFMGHSDPKITQGYICAQKPVDENVMSFFK